METSEQHQAVVKELLEVAMVRNPIAGKREKRHVRRRREAKEPVLQERVKTCLCLRGKKASPMVKEFLGSLHRMRSPHSILLRRENDILPFEDGGEASLEFLMTKNDAGLFALVNHNKKRPDNLILGTTFDGRVLDLVELGVSGFCSSTEFKGSVAKRVGSKPCMVFAGDEWNNDEVMSRLQLILVDLFRGEVIDSVAISGLDHVIFVSTEKDGQQCHVNIRYYHIGFKKVTAGQSPDVSLDLCGPCFDLNLRRHRLAATDLWNQVLKAPKQ